MPIRVFSNLLNGLVPNLAIRLPSQGSAFKLSDIFDGFLLVQKRKKNIRQKWKELYGGDNSTDGVKLWKPKRNITTCPDCGSFHEFHTICRECFNRLNKIERKTEQQLVESQDTKTWFEPNVSQVKNPASQDQPKVVKET